MTDEEFEKRLVEVLTRIEVPRGYLKCERDQQDPKGRFYIQLVVTRPDSITGLTGEGRSGKRYLSKHMVDGEIVRQAFSLVLAYEEHEVREHFKYKGKSVFGPHIAVDKLVEIADDLEVRT